MASVTAENVTRYVQPPTHRLFGSERRILEEYWSPEMRVLDLGCGSGRVTKHMVSIGARVWACDLNASALRALRSNLVTNSTAAIFRADARQLPVADCSFAMVIFAFNGIDFLHPESDRFRALQEIGRILRPGGYFVFSSHNPLGMLLTPRGLRSWAHWRWRVRSLLSGERKERY